MIKFIVSRHRCLEMGILLILAFQMMGQKLIASYLYVSGEKIKTNVVFYNFSDVGQNETQRIVGGFNHYNDTIVGDVKFYGNTTAIAIGENIISIYNINEYPNLVKEITIDNEIQKVIFSDKYIGLLLDNSDTGISIN